MKKFLLLAITLATVCLSSFGQSPGLQTTTLNGGTNNVSIGTTNTYANSGTTFVLTKSATIELQARYALDGAGTAGIPIWFDTSVDNSNWVTNGILKWDLTPAGTASLTARTNISCGAPFLRIRQVGNLNSTSVTNLVISGFVKAAGF